MGQFVESKGSWNLDVDCHSCDSNSTDAPQSPDKASLRSSTTPPGSRQFLANGQPIDDAFGSISIGSALHGTGRCKPCAWFWKPGSCTHRELCSRCHICPPGEIKLRKKEKLVILRSQVSEPSPKPFSAAESEEPGREVLPRLLHSPPGLSIFGESIPACCSGYPQLTRGFHGSVQALPQKMATSPPPPPSTPPVLASLGSLKHGLGICRPCSQVWKAGGCAAGRSCEDCHLCPQGDSKMLAKAKLAGISLREVRHADLPTFQCLCLTPANPFERNQLAVGSVLHGSGHCSPCAWFWKPQGCQNGADCNRCHLCPPGEVKQRKKAKVQVLRHGSPSWPNSADASAAILFLKLRLDSDQAT